MSFYRKRSRNLSRNWYVAMGVGTTVSGSGQIRSLAQPWQPSVRACVHLGCELELLGHGQEMRFCLLTAHVAPAEAAVLCRRWCWMGQCVKVGQLSRSSARTCQAHTMNWGRRKGSVFI